MAIIFSTDDWLNAGTADFLPESSARTFYFRFKTTLNASFQRLIYVSATTPGNDGLDIEIGTAGQILMEIAGAVYMTCSSVDGVISNGVEYIAIVTTDGSGTHANTHIYLNGSEVSYAAGNADGSVLLDTSAGIKAIGGKSNGSACLNGTYYECAVLDRVISAGEITTLSSNPQFDAIKAMSGLVRYFAMNDGADGTSADGDTVTDYSVNAAHATGDDGANNTGLTWSGTRKVVGALAITSNLPTSTRKVSKLPNAQTVQSNLPTVIEKVTKLPSAQTIQSDLPTTIEKVTKTPDAQVITSNLPTPTVSAGGAVNATFNASALTIQSALGTPTPSVKKNAEAQTIQSNLPTVTVSGVVNKTVIVDALTIQSSLQTGSKTVTKLPAGMTIASAMGGVTPKVAKDVSAFQIIASLPGVTISGGSSSRTVIVDALTITSVLGSATPIISYKQIPITSKHQQPRYVNRLNKIYRVTQSHFSRNVSDHVNRNTLDYVAVNYLLDPDGNYVLDPDGNRILVGDGT